MPTYEGTILDEGGAVFNVNAYASVHAAVNAAVANGRGVVYFPPGIYTISSPILLEGRNDIKLIGAGPNATQLVQANDNGVIVVRDNGSLPSTRITIQGFWIGISEGSPRSGGAGVSVYSNVSIPASEIEVHDVVLMNVPYPFYFENVHQSRVSNVRVTANISGAVKGTLFRVVRCISLRMSDLFSVIPTSPAGKYPGDAMSIEGDCDTVILTDSELGDSMGRGVALTLSGGSSGARLTRLHNVFVETAESAGFHVEAGRDVRLDGCHAALNGGSGFSVTGGDSVVLTNCFSLRNVQHGFYISNAAGTAVLNSTASNNSDESHSSYDGCYVEADTKDVRIIGNRFGNFVLDPDRQRHGINLQQGTDYIIASMNILSGNDQAGLLELTTENNVLTNNNLF